MSLFNKKVKTVEQPIPTELAGRVPKQPVGMSSEKKQEQPQSVSDVLHMLVDHINRQSTAEDISAEFYAVLSNVINGSNTDTITRLGVLKLLSDEITRNLFGRQKE